MLVQAPEWVKFNAADFENYLRRNFGDMLGWGEKENNAIVDRRTLRVDGRAVEFAIGEGVSSDGELSVDGGRVGQPVWHNPDLCRGAGDALESGCDRRLYRLYSLIPATD